MNFLIITLTPGMDLSQRVIEMLDRMNRMTATRTTVMEREMTVMLWSFGMEITTPQVDKR